MAGIAYHFLSFGWAFGVVLAMPMVDQFAPDMPWGRVAELTGGSLLSHVALGGQAGWIMILPLAIAMFRAAGGLARLAPLERWQTAAQESGRDHPRMRRIMREGKGTTRAAGLLWLQVLLMMGLATAALVLPAWAVLSTMGFSGWSPLSAVVTGLAVALTSFYGFLLGILFQLALHSMVRNRRGVGSALLHAWRLVRNDPGAAIRAATMDAVLQLVASLGLVTVGFLGGLIPPLSLASFLCQAMIYACTGCIRCLYWSRVYEEFGGLSTAPE
ncbi:MAG: hypothetical protein ACI8QC_003974 [Planctomycetota bacterium]|jgi:hypothetical protein